MQSGGKPRRRLSAGLGSSSRRGQGRRASGWHGLRRSSSFSSCIQSATRAPAAAPAAAPVLHRPTLLLGVGRQPGTTTSTGGAAAGGARKWRSMRHQTSRGRHQNSSERIRAHQRSLTSRASSCLIWSRSQMSRASRRGAPMQPTSNGTCGSRWRGYTRTRGSAFRWPSSWRRCSRRRRS